MSDRFDDDVHEEAAAAAGDREPLARAAHHRPGAGAGVLRADDVLVDLHRPALVPLRGLRRRLLHAVLDPHRAVPRVRRADGASPSAPTCTSPTASGPFFRPDSPEQAGLERYRDAVAPVRGWLLAGVSAVIGPVRRHRGGGGVAHLPACGQPQRLRHAPTCSSTRTSASTSSSCRGCTTSSTS